MTTEKETPPVAAEGDKDCSFDKQAQDTAEAVDAPEANTWDDEDPAPAGLKRPPGLVGDIADYVYSNAPYPMLEAAVLAALGLVAGVAGRTYNINGTGLNLYLLLLAPTGRGKEAMAMAIDSLTTGVRESGAPMVDDFIGPSEFASGQALMREVGERPCFLSLFGEFGIRLKALCDPRANPIEQVQQRVLLDLYNKSGKTNVLRSKSHADREKNTKLVRSPAISILGESTPDVIYENIGIGEIRSGLLPRFVILACDSPRPSRNRNASHAPPHELVTKLRNIVATALQANATGSGSAPVVIDVLMNDEATLYLDEVEHDLNDIYNAAPESAEGQLATRTFQNILRVAALLAVGVNHLRPMVTEEYARWATDFVRSCAEDLARRFTAGFIGTGETRQEAELKKYVMEYLRMNPLKRVYSYRVAKNIASERHLIPHGYLRRRAKQCVAFTQDRRGLDKALDGALLVLMKDGLLMPVNSVQLQQAYSSRAKVYALAGTPNEWRDSMD